MAARRKTTVHWSDSHERLLRHAAGRVLARYGRDPRGPETAELINVAWLTRLRFRREDQLKGCCRILMLTMDQYLRQMLYGKTDWMREHSEAAVISLESLTERIGYQDLLDPADDRHEPSAIAIERQEHHLNAAVCRELLDRLAAADRRLLCECYGLDGPARSLTQIAGRCGVSRETVRVRRKRILGQLREEARSMIYEF